MVILLKDGILLVNKPVGITSHDVIDRVKDKLKIRKIGHCGTLDPFASGLLVILINNATKLQQLYLKEDKQYEGTILFGSKYDTLDTTGSLIEQLNFDKELNEIKDVAINFPKNYMQTPPIYSAVKVGGKKGYEYARANQEVVFTPREVSIYRIEILEKINNLQYKFKALVSSGTYIRKLAEDLAEKLGNIASLSSLSRISSGNFKLSNAVSLDQLKMEDVISTYDLFKNFPKLVVSDYIRHLVINGIYLDERQIETDNDFIAVDQNNEMLAYYLNTGNYQYKPIYFFKTREERDLAKLKEGENT